VTDAAHVDGDEVAEVAFGARARTGGRNPVYTRLSATSATCASTYCHGGFAGGANGGNGATVNWTSTSAVTCTSCHGNPPSSGEHSKHVSGEGVACYVCHNDVLGSSNAIAVPAAHLNGTKNVAFGGTWNGRTITGTFTASSRSCSVTCHGNETW
jgi:predicted CxxxxCH...CXXCH cytochrome family protein